MGIEPVGGFYLMYDKHSDNNVKIRVDDLEYHTSYDWLTPVFNKIRSLLEKQHDGDIEIDDNHIRIHWDGRRDYNHTVNGNPFDIEVAYEAIIHFIKWFEKQKGYS
jgi:hypothetical protein